MLCFGGEFTVSKPKQDPIDITFNRCDNPACEAYHLCIEGSFLGLINIPMLPEGWRAVIKLIEDTLDGKIGKTH